MDKGKTDGADYGSFTTESSTQVHTGTTNNENFIFRIDHRVYRGHGDINNFSPYVLCGLSDLCVENPLFRQSHD